MPMPEKTMPMTLEEYVRERGIVVGDVQPYLAIKYAWLSAQEAMRERAAAVVERDGGDGRSILANHIRALEPEWDEMALLSGPLTPEQTKALIKACLETPLTELFSSRMADLLKGDGGDHLEMPFFWGDARHDGGGPVIAACRFSGYRR